MNVLRWDKHKRVMSKEDWSSISADSAPPGVYQPNMSDEDRARWKAKLVGHTKGHPQVEIRKDSMVLIVSLGDGYLYKQYGKAREHGQSTAAYETTRGINVHLAIAGAAQLTFKEWEQMQQAVNEAKQFLKARSWKKATI